MLYLIHGFSDAANAWIEGRPGQPHLSIPWLHDGKMKPMVVVMPRGYGTMEMIDSKAPFARRPSA